MQKNPEFAENMYLSTPLAKLFVKTALPIILIMFTNGLYTVVDGWFVGRFVGAEALSAVTMVFPLYMIVIALGTLVSSGFSSVLARMLGAGEYDRGAHAMSSALILSTFVCAFLMVLYELFGSDLIVAIANGSPSLAGMGDLYISLTIFLSPVFFLIAMLSDSFRCQGKLGLMTLITVLSVLFNMFFNYLLIVEFNMGVAGSAYGTALAQTAASVIALGYMYSNEGVLRFKLSRFTDLFRHWFDYIALGAPTSLSYIGVSAMSASIIYQIQIWNADTYETTVAAYGIVTRLLTFGYMPLLGLTLAQQAIIGNNFGARNWDRVVNSLKITIVTSLLYCAALQVIFITLAGPISSIFVDDPRVIAETARILPPQILLYLLFGPLLMLPSFFQSIGDAKRAGILGLTKIYVFGIPFILFLPTLIGEMGIWYAGVVTEVAAFSLSALVLWQVFSKGKRGKAFLETRAANASAD
ncbi:MATE family efflux transporter [Sneathiella aquimaris]|uniref:MATE family efflux transporter n=1 Tax=Sneathiella aquimaris TaxID=2599305 RepID=UPI00146D0E5C|nr:MATE family efflux transporter [Sneathiella aquimaris]